MTNLVTDEKANTGISHLFSDQTYHFQALRVLSDACVGGADIAEVLQAISSIPAGDDNAWYREFSLVAERSERLADECNDAVSRGLARHRAHTYWRTAEFLLPADDKRRDIAWERQINTFDEGLNDLGVAFERLQVPFENGQLNGIFYPVEGGEKKPLVVIVGGFDGTLEELYFLMGKAANDRGYSVLTYEGPGQGGCLRESNMFFTHEWEKPTSAMLDAFLLDHNEFEHIVLTGISLGGYLAPRAAAFDERIDGVISFNVMFDFGAVVAPFGQYAKDPVLSQVPGVKWALDNGKWVFGTDTAEDFIDAASKFNLQEVAQQIKGDVLILAGEKDHFVPLKQVSAFENELTNARSVESFVFDEASGGGEHCQVGASTLWQAKAFDWMARKFK